jgi:integrase/recombinase XerD
MKNIKESKKEFLLHCRYEKNLSPKTLKAYKVDLAQFIAHLTFKQYSLSIPDVDKNSIREYIQSISSFKAKTIKRKIATIKAMFNFLEYEDKIIVNPFRKLRIQIKEPYRLPNVMNIHEIESIIRSAYDMKAPNNRINSRKYKERIQDITVFELLFATGIRVSELSQLRSECINLSTGLIKVRGKGDKERIITLCNKECLKAVREYNACFHKTNTGSGYFLINRLNKRLSEQSIRFIVKKHAQLAGLERKITPHVFRHSFATLLLEQDVDIKYIQHLLGHSSIMTTQIYTHVNSERQKEILSKRHPRRSFSMA